MNIHRTRFCVILLCLSFFLIISCGVKETSSIGDSQQDISILPCVVLLPTEIHYDETLLDVSVTRDELMRGASHLDTLLRSQLQHSGVTKIIETGQLEHWAEDMSNVERISYKMIGDKAQCKSILKTTLHEFRQRQGGSYSVDSPASAAFELSLLDAETGRNLWTTSFNETQSSLLSNLFNLSKAMKRGLKWITVEELVRQGVGEKLKDCPYLFQ